MTEALKRCPRCGETKPLSLFGNNRGHADGKGTYCRACVNAMAAARRVRKPIEARPCLHCQTPFVPAHPNTHYCSDACREARQKARTSENHKRWYYANWTHRRALAKAWRAANRDRARQHRRDGYYRDPAKEKAWHRTWVERNRARVAAYSRDYERQKQTLNAAKADEALRAGGFLLVRYTYRGETFYRAALEGRPLGPNEAVLARYEHFDGRWVVHPPVVVPQAFRTLVERLVKREKFGRARRYREAL